MGLRLHIQGAMSVSFIGEIHKSAEAAEQPVFSVEFFPPKTEAGDRTLSEKVIPTLLTSDIRYCSVTYGAGGSTREKTLSIVEGIQKQHDLTSMAHLTCVNSTREQIAGVLEEAKARGIRNILALRGDPPAGQGEFVPVEGGFSYSTELVRFIKECGDFCVGVAGFPEGHIACQEGREKDWGYLKGKVDAGADFVITQLFFDNADYYAFRDYVTDHLGVDVPLIPGLLPIQSGNQVKRFTELCGASIPAGMEQRLNELGEDNEAVTEYGIEFSIEQIRDLLANGVPGVHFYCLNKAHSVMRIMRSLGYDNRP